MGMDTRKGITDPHPYIKSGFEAYQMNERNQVVGSYYKECESRAYVIDVERKRLKPLGKGTLPDTYDQECGLASSADAINDLGQVAGHGNRMPFSDTNHSFIWTSKDGYKIIPSDHDPKKYDVTPTSINNAAQVVGFFSEWGSFTYHLYYWSAPAGWHELRDLLDPADPLTSKIVLKGQGASSSPQFIERIPKINDRGQIMVTGSYKGSAKDIYPERAFLLVPVESEASESADKR